MYLGVDYYPEQWDPELLDADLCTIKELNANTIRIGEFAWHLMEPIAGKFDFSYFDAIIAAAKQHELSVIFGTPTATPPAWLVAAHPDILSKFTDGSARAFGGRHIACYAAPAYREACRKIVKALASHYRNEPGIIAWQTDNELGHEGSDECWCQHCHLAFQNYLEKKFAGDIHALNYTYGTCFWSQQYNSFAEIPLPAPTITTHNPALRLDWERFRSQLIVDFHTEQVELLRSELGKNAYIIHDFPGGGLDKHVDYAAVAGPLDKVAYNNYPVWGGQKEPLPAHEVAFGLDYMRGLKRQNFWVTEAIMGAQGHDITGYLPRPRQAQMWSYQAMAHGCDSLLYFRYRGATKGAEQFCYGILDADNQRRRRFYEVQDFFNDISAYDSALSAPVQASVAILYDYDSLASFRIQRQSLLLDPHAQMRRWHQFFYNRNIMVDVLNAADPQLDLSAYRVIVVPHLIVAKPKILDHLRTCAQTGAQVIFTYRSAVKDTDNNLVFGQLIPLGIVDLIGGVIEETESVQETDCFTLAKALTGPENWVATGQAGVFRDMVRPTTAEVLYYYQDDFYTEFAALTRQATGSGHVYYVATSLDDTLTDQLVARVVADANIPIILSPLGVEVVNRESDTQAITLVMNHTGQIQTWQDLELRPYETKVIIRNKVSNIDK